MAIILIFQTKDEEPVEVPLFHKIIVGRSSSADLKIDDSKISSKHCSFEMNAKGALIFSDLGSTNGSYLNGSHVTQVVFKVNDVVTIGQTTVKIDEEQLSVTEKMKIGIANILNKDLQKTLPANSVLLKKDDLKDPSNVKSVIRKKSLEREHRDISNWGGAGDNIIEQEESSGQTRFLKLDKNKKKK